MTEITHKDTAGGLPEARSRIQGLEQWMKQQPKLCDAPPDGQVAQVELPVTHHFSKGLYARELFIPKGVMAVGKIHRFAHLNVISKGAILVASEHGECKIEAPCTWESLPGAKHAGFALEDTIWTTFHPTDETDVDRIEAQVIAKDYDDPVLLEELANAQRGGVQRLDEQGDSGGEARLLEQLDDGAAPPLPIR